MKTCLVVANRTLPGSKLAAAIREEIREGDVVFYVVVPLTPVSRGVVWDEDESADAARERLTAFLDALRDQGVTADGEIGDPDPTQAVRDVLRGRDVDKIILSTLPPGISRWLRADVPSRLAGAVEVPVAVITQDDAAVASSG